MIGKRSVPGKVVLTLGILRSLVVAPRSFFSCPRAHCQGLLMDSYLLPKRVSLFRYHIGNHLTSTNVKIFVICTMPDCKDGTAPRAKPPGSSGSDLVPETWHDMSRNVPHDRDYGEDAGGASLGRAAMGARASRQNTAKPDRDAPLAIRQRSLGLACLEAQDDIARRPICETA